MQTKQGPPLGMEYCRNQYTKCFCVCAKKTPRFQPRESYGFQETLATIGKIMVCSYLAAVRGTESPECIECTTFVSRQKPLGNVANSCISCGPCVSGRSDARGGSVVACKILRLPGNLGKLLVESKTLQNPDVKSGSLPLTF